MVHFGIRIESPLSAPDAWGKVLDLRAHSVVIPFTTVTGTTLDAAELTDGSRFCARTSLGPVGFDDLMVLEQVTQPTGTTPGHAGIRKEGRLIRGRIELAVTPNGTGSVVEWNQDITVNRVPGLAAPVVALVARAAYGTTLKKLLTRP